MINIFQIKKDIISLNFIYNSGELSILFRLQTNTLKVFQHSAQSIYIILEMLSDLHKLHT